MAPAGIGSSVEGLHAVAAAVAAGRVTRLTVASGRLRRPEVAEIVAAARSAGAVVEEADEVVGETDAPQGLVAQARPIESATLEAALARTQPPALLVLDHVEDPRNVGAIARSAAAAGLGGIVVPTRRAAPLGATAFKAAAGALERLAVVEVSSIADTITDLKRREVWTVGMAADAPTPLFGLELLAEPVAVVVGAEGRGLGRLVAERCDALASIPLAAGVESLNASVAAALAAFEVTRVRGTL